MDLNLRGHRALVTGSNSDVAGRTPMQSQDSYRGAR